MSQNIALKISYDGTPFYGWQKSAEGPTIEALVQKAIEQIVQHPVELQAASRTDRGVHATGQVVNFFTSKEVAPDRLLLSLNALLPKEIRIVQVKTMPTAFHPTLDTTGKEYHYHICLGAVQLPQHRLFSWHVPQKLDIVQMQRAAKLLEGTHDFTAFCTKVSYTDAIRTLEKVALFEKEGRLLITVEGDSFLYKMVRTLVGTLVDVGKGKLCAVEEIVQKQQRVEAGVTAPAHGLFLKKVRYPGSLFP